MSSNLCKPEFLLLNNVINVSMLQWQQEGLYCIAFVMFRVKDSEGSLINGFVY